MLGLGRFMRHTPRILYLRTRKWIGSHALVLTRRDIGQRAFDSIKIEMENCNKLGIPTLCIQ
jgi:hypothetical protein